MTLWLAPIILAAIIFWRIRHENAITQNVRDEQQSWAPEVELPRAFTTIETSGNVFSI